MKKLLAALMGLSLCSPVFAQPNVQPHSLAATGCMKLRECTDDVEPITDITQLTDRYGEYWANAYQPEIKELIKLLNEKEVEIYLAPAEYFSRNTRGLYYTDVNRLFLNDHFADQGYIFIEVLRHEGWHAAQDCMAGTIDNSFIAVIYDDTLIPPSAKVITEARYGLIAPKAIPWEQEAYWAGSEASMTTEALRACVNGKMWETYSPTPLTKKWLEENNFID